MRASIIALFMNGLLETARFLKRQNKALNNAFPNSSRLKGTSLSKRIERKFRCKINRIGLTAQINFSSRRIPDMTPRKTMPAPRSSAAGRGSRHGPLFQLWERAERALRAVGALRALGTLESLGTVRSVRSLESSESSESSESLKLKPFGAPLQSLISNLSNLPTPILTGA